MSCNSLLCHNANWHKKKQKIKTNETKDWIQTVVLKSLNCIWFNRNEQKDRNQATQRIKDHIANINNPRLLIFPEGTCVNNKYCIQFKQGTFATGAEICPVAIKYKL